MSWVSSFQKHFSEYEGYVVSKEDLLSLIEAYMLDTHSHYVVRRCRDGYNLTFDKINYDSINVVMQDMKASFASVQPHIPDDGIPFIHLGASKWECHRGVQRHKTKTIPHLSLEDSSETSKKISTSKKLDCPSIIRIRRIIKFTDYKFDSTELKDDKAIPSLEIKLCDKQLRKFIKMENRYYIQLPLNSSHKNHIVGEGVDTHIDIDKRISAFIRDKVKNENITTSQEMLTLINDYVRHVLFKNKRFPALSNTRYWPTLKQVQNQMLLSNKKQRCDALDQIELENMVEFWRNENVENTIELRLKSDKKMIIPINIIDKSKNIYKTDQLNSFQSLKKKFLFIQQMHWQRKLLYLYGDNVCILYHYRTNRFSLNLFFLIVPTNCIYIVVASFIIESSFKADIEEALGFLKSVNPEWCPKAIMCDLSTSEMGAIDAVFKDGNTEILICDFQRLQNWNKYLAENLIKNGEIHNQLMNLMRVVAESSSEEEYRENLQKMRESEVWRASESIQRWFEKWVSFTMRWVKHYRQDRFLYVDTNSGMEKLNSTIEKMFLLDTKMLTVTEVATIVTNKFIPYLLSWYSQINSNWSSQALDCGLSFLQNRPQPFVEHVTRVWLEAQSLVNHMFVQDSFGAFHAMNSSNHSHEIKLDNGYGMPSCSCSEWRISHYPCKHILGGLMAGAFGWKDLPSSYTTNPLLTLDYTFVGVAASGEELSSVTEQFDVLDEFRSHLKKLESLSNLQHSPSHLENYSKFNLILKQMVVDISSSFGAESSNVEGRQKDSNLNTDAGKGEHM